MSDVLIQKSEKIAKKISNLRNKSGQPGTLRDFDLIEVENLADEIWQAGLKPSQISDFVNKIYAIKIKIKDLVDFKPENLSKIQLTISPENDDLIHSVGNVLNAAIEKVRGKQDVQKLIRLIDLFIDITNRIIRTINKYQNLGLKFYSIRQLIKDSEEFGYHLKKSGLKTNQIRKFLDSVNRLKVEISIKVKEIETESDAILLEELDKSKKIYTQVVLLKQKIDYAAAREKAVKPFQEVINAAIDQVYDTDDFERFFQLIESIIAYHKAAGGGD